MVYVLATSPNLKTPDLVLLIYRTGVENIRTLYKVVSIDTNPGTIESASIFVGG